MITAGRGDLVQTWFDTGAFGYTVLWGIVEKAGPKAITIRWESGIRNRVSRTHRDIKLVDERNLEDARKALGLPPATIT